MSGGTATTTDPLTSPPAEPLAPSPNPPAVPMDPAPAAESRRPTIGAHAQLAIPHGAGVGLNFVTANERFSFELAGQGASLSAGDTKISIGNLGAAARYHVFDGAFFLGVAVGQQTLSGEGQDTVQGQSVTAKIDIKSTHITPQFGWMSGKADGGFFFETMLGYQNPLSSSAELTTNAPSAIQNDPEYINLDRQVRDDGKKIGEIGLPVIAFKLGYLF